MYYVLADDSPIRHRGVIAVFYHEVIHFQLKSHQTHGANVTRFQIASGERHWFVLGCYLTLDDASIIKSIVSDIGQRPQGAAFMVPGDANADLAAPEGNSHEEDITDALVSDILEYKLSHFLPYRK